MQRIKKCKINEYLTSTGKRYQLQSDSLSGHLTTVDPWYNYIKHVTPVETCYYGHMILIGN